MYNSIILVFVVLFSIYFIKSRKVFLTGIKFSVSYIT